MAVPIQMHTTNYISEVGNYYIRLHSITTLFTAQSNFPKNNCLSEMKQNIFKETVIISIANLIFTRNHPAQLTAKQN